MGEVPHSRSSLGAPILIGSAISARTGVPDWVRGPIVRGLDSGCGSLEVSFHELIKRVAYTNLAGLLLAGIVPPLALTQPGWKCHACGHSWKASSDPSEPAP
jgi:hypothetical protein